jgi:hypothetical protein
MQCAVRGGLGQQSPTGDNRLGVLGVINLDLWNGLVRGSKEINNSAPGTFTLNAWRNATDRLDPNAIQDIVVVCRYTVA